MSAVCRNYPIFECALRVVGAGQDYQEEGDIVELRPEGRVGGIGLKEMHKFLWLRLCGADDTVMYDLRNPWVNNLDTLENKYAMKQYKIPFERLLQTCPSFNIALARDINTIYQPFLYVDNDNGYFVASSCLFDIHGLVYNKATTRFF